MKLDNETISLLAFFENLTKARVKDCFFDKEKITPIHITIDNDKLLA